MSRFFQRFSNLQNSNDFYEYYRKKKLFWGLLIFFSVLVLLLSAFIALLFGSAGPIGPVSTRLLTVSDVIQQITKNSFNLILQMFGFSVQEENTIKKVIIWDIRLPRVIMGALAGMALAVAGTIMQAIFRNPMADPYILGLASGASVGASIAIIAGGTIGFLAGYTLPIFAFGGSLLTIILVYYISNIRGQVRVDTLLLSGIAVGSFMAAVTSFLTYLSGQHLRPIIFWLMGGLSLSEGDWDSVVIAAVVIIPSCMICLLFARSLNLLLLGEETAQYRGLNVQKFQKILLVLASLITGVAVAFTGVIGFVGLIIPHLIRLISGPDHRILLPTSCLIGGSFLIIADVVAKTIIYPTELPVGIITALCGTPFFLYLLRKQKKIGF
ncbi:MAG: iron chelate uptake ABC transporter family permease subunit [Candidatus Heimdallarchaeota archaeon]|nr:MAG: iron chelate uptake ABC transporter family permease subunit [Candidatus Heimdallarchaeota archaeon]